MRILMIARLQWPHVGGVERHVYEVGKWLRVKGESVKIISEEDIKYPHIKFLGLIYIWFWVWRNRKLIEWADVIHCHDVFIWFLPFRFLYPKKPVFTTFHGWEGVWPIPWKFIFLKRVAAKLSWGTIAVGRYIEKYYGIKVDHTIYGGMDLRFKNYDLRKKQKNTIVFLGREDQDTGINEFKKWLKNNGKKYNVRFIHNIKNPERYLKMAEYCVPGGYLSYIEAKQAGCKITTFANNLLKKDYWKEIKKVKKFPMWDKVADEYISLYNSKK